VPLDEENKPRLGETVHYVAAKEDDSGNISRGDEIPVIVTKVKRHKVYKDRFEITGVGITTEGFHEIHAYDDQECKLPGSWHRDEDCAEEGWTPDSE
jgi:hypothetical protein